MKQQPADIIILNLCTTNDNHIMYGSWEYEVRQAEIFCNFGSFFALYPNNNPKNEKMKKTHKDIILQKCTKNHDHMW